MGLWDLRNLLDGLRADNLRFLTPLLLAMFRAPTLRPDAAKIIAGEIRARRKTAFALGSEFLRDEAGRQGISNPFMPSARGYSDQAIETVFETFFGWLDTDQGKEMSAAQRDAKLRAQAFRAAEALARHVEAASRDVIADSASEVTGLGDKATTDEVMAQLEQASAEAEAQAAAQADAEFNSELEEILSDGSEGEEVNGVRPVAWARVLTGADSCFFCTMLAARGAAYGSRSAAMVTQDLATGFARGYHNNCDCMPVPIFRFSDWPGKETSNDLFELWRAETAGLSGSAAINAWRKFVANNADLIAQIVGNPRATA